MAILKNAKHEQFCQLIASGLSVTKAYTSCGYSVKGATRSALRLRKNAQVAVRVAELQQSVAELGIEKAGVDRARVLARLDELSRDSQQNEQFSAAIRAEELLGKELGMFRDRLEISGEASIEARLIAGRERVFGRVELAAPRQIEAPTPPISHARNPSSDGEGGKDAER